jgi:hypothetical protein
VSDLERPADELLDCFGVDIVFWGDKDKGGGAALRVCTGDDAATVVAAFCRLGGTLGISNAELGCRVAAVD